MVQIKSGNYAQTIYRKDDVVWRTGTSAMPSELLTLIKASFLSPIQDYKNNINYHAVYTDLPAKGANGMRCVNLHGQNDERLPLVFYSPSYCFDRQASVLRSYVQQDGKLEITRNKIQEIDGHYLSNELIGNKGHKPAFKAQVELFGYLQSAGKLQFNIPSYAVPDIPPVTLTQAESQKLHLEQPMPDLTNVGMRPFVSADSTIEIYVGADGHVFRLAKIDRAPFGFGSLIRNAAMKWTYRPYLVDGKPVEFKTSVTITFPFNNDPYIAK